jgi:hypothetical protein
MSITDSKYFTYGSAHEILHGDDPKLIQYALYNSIIDRFVITSTSFELLQLISILFSSRYYFIICRLDRVANFDRNLIDNESALGWTAQKSRDLPFAAGLRLLKPVEPNLLEEKELIDFKDQEYLLAAACWLDLLILDTEIFKTDFIYQYEDLLSGILPFAHPKKVLTDKILHIIYQEFDFATAEKQINELINSYSHQDLSPFNNSRYFKSKVYE